MHKPYTQSWFAQWCSKNPREITPSEAFQLAFKLGPLARWWLHPEVLRAANIRKRELFQDDSDGWPLTSTVPSQLGACWILSVRQGVAKSYRCLRPCLVWPLRWRTAPAHNRRLPMGLQRLADEVRQAVSAKFRVPQASPKISTNAPLASNETTAWALDFLDTDWQDVIKWNDFPSEWNSAWIPLASGLVAAMHGILPDARVWASAAWDEGVRSVDHLKEKLLCALDFGATAFFVPFSQKEEANKIAQQFSNLSVHPLNNSTNLWEAMAPLLERLYVPPDRFASPQARAHYFLSIRDKGRAAEYYRTHIVDDIVAEHKNLAQLGATHLTIIVSESFDLPYLLARVFRPNHILLLFDKTMTKQAMAARETLTALEFEPTVHIREFHLDAQLASISEAPPCNSEPTQKTVRDQLVEQFQTFLTDFLGDTASSRLVVDVTAGQTLMKLALYDAIPRNSLAVCCQSKLDPATRRPIPFTEEFHVWRVRHG